MDTFNAVITAVTAVIWHDTLVYVLLFTGVLFTLWSGFSQYRALTHGAVVVRGLYDNRDDPGAINHFQALSAALSGTVGLGNIAGVALAIALGGPGAVFWMWVVGLIGMAVKMTEVTLSMLYRNTDVPERPHGGPMWVVAKGLGAWRPTLAGAGKFIGGLFCVTVLIQTFFGNMFQAWNVGDVTETYFRVPSVFSGTVLAILVGLVIIGGVKRIGRVAGSLVPLMVVLYFISAILVMIVNFGIIPEMFALIFTKAFSPQEATGAFLGGTMGYALLMGMKRALYSSEAGIGSSPMAHSAVKTDEPVREGVVAGLEPFIDTIVVCTLTSMVILSTGVWQRDAEATLPADQQPIAVEAMEDAWTLATHPAPVRQGDQWEGTENVYLKVRAMENHQTGNNLHRLNGEVVERDGTMTIEWGTLTSATRPEVLDRGIYVSYPGATLTAKAFDAAVPGFELGKYLITIASWLFAISTIITWVYYGEQAVVYIAGERVVLGYKLLLCVLLIVATVGLIETPDELENFSALGMGFMVWVNIPIMLLFGSQAMRAYKRYIGELRSGAMQRSPNPPRWRDLISGRDVG